MWTSNDLGILQMDLLGRMDLTYNQDAFGLSRRRLRPGNI